MRRAFTRAWLAGVMVVKRYSLVLSSRPSCNSARSAGPTLAGVFGRKIATLPGYNFSEALKKFNIVWTPETVAKLFEIGPMAYTPGTKMPEQRIGSAEDRDALVKFLERATKAN